MDVAASRAEKTRMADRLGLSGRVRFLGSVDTETVIEEFGRSDAFIMAVKPSGGDVSGLSASRTR